MSPEPQQPNSGNAQRRTRLRPASPSGSRQVRTLLPDRRRGVLAILAVVTFIWMHIHLFPPENLGQLLHSLLRVDLFFLVLLFAITMYLRQAMNQNTRTILRALANTRQR